MSETVGLAVIGCGGIAGGRGEARRGHLQTITQLATAHLRACADIDAAAAEHAAQKYGADYWTADLDRVLNDPEVQGVLICTRHDSHADLAIRAARAGKHILIEKPFAMTVDECRAMIAAAEASGVILMPAFRCRYCSGVTRAREVIDSPALIVGQLMDARWGDEIWAQDPVIGGGEVLSQGVHMFDLVCHLAGSDPVSIYAAGGTLTHDPQRTSVIDNAFCTLTFANGVVASVLTGDAGMSPLTSKFFVELFKDGVKSATIHDRLKQVEFWGVDAPGVSEPDEHMELEVRDFVEAIANKTPAPIPARDGLRATLLAHAAFTSIRTGQPQPIDIDATLQGKA